MSETCTIAPCSAAQRAGALRVLHAGLSADQQIALVQTLEATAHQDDAMFTGLLVAVASEEFVGAAWVQLAAGKTAVVWPPAANSLAAAALMRAVALFLDEHRVTLAQFLVSDESTVNRSLLEAIDFKKLAKLAYLTVERRLFPTEQPRTELSFQPEASTDSLRLGNVLLRTYEGSLDCPLLNGVRDTGSVLAGYRQQGTFAPERWFFVQRQERDIGALILTSHADDGNRSGGSSSGNRGNWELVYMGLVPEVRGHGLGRQLLEFAMWKAGLGDAERLVLAVDEANQPALAMYQRAGFVAWDYRTVYARLRPHSQGDPTTSPRLEAHNE